MKNLNCPYFKDCGACDFLETGYNDQLQQKRLYVKDQLEKAGIFCNVENTVGLYYPYAFRNKVHLGVTEQKGNVLVGFFEEGNNSVVNIQSCLMNGPWVDKIITITKQFVSDFKVKPYHKLSRNGILKYVVARNLSGNIMVTLVVTSENFAGKDWFYEQLKKEFKTASLYLNLNTHSDNAVFDEKGFVYKFGGKYLEGKMLGIKFELSPQSFFQTNEQVAEKIYKEVLNLSQVNEKSTVLDLYSGIGITSLVFAKNGAYVYAIESVKSATADAVRLSKQNHLNEEIKVITGKCEEVLPALSEELKQNGKTDLTVFLDPPRSGAEPAVLQSIMSLRPNKIIYLSCNPISLAENLYDLKGYTVQKVIPFDMFPHTRHIEVLVSLERKS